MGVLTSNPIDNPARIVHVVAPRAGGESSVRALACLLRSGSLPERVVVLGNQDDRASLEVAGVAADARMPWEPRGPRYSLSRFGSAGWQRDIEALFSDETAVCAWGFDTARAWDAVAGARFGKASIVIDDGTPGPAAAWDRWNDVTLVACGESNAQSWRSVGAIDVRVAPMRFSVDQRQRPVLMSRDDVRDRLDLGPNARLIGMVADPAGRGDARWFAFVLGLMYAAGLEVGGLIPRDLTWERRGLRFVRDHGRRWGLRVWDHSMIEMAHACDVVLVPPWISPTLARESSDLRPACGAALIVALAATGVPVIAPACEMTGELSHSVPLMVAASSAGTEYGARVLDVIAKRPAPSPPVEPVERVDQADTFASVVAAVLREAIMTDSPLISA